MDVSDEELADRCKSELPYGTRSFETLVRRYESTIFATCLRFLRNDEEAEEVTQDIFLRVFHGLKNFEGKSKFRTWLYRIVHNTCSTRYTKLKKRREKGERVELDPNQIAAALPKSDQFTGPLGEALEDLSEDDRQILVLRFVAELSIKEISETLDVKLSAAKMRLNRAVKRLRVCYDESRDESEEK